MSSLSYLVPLLLGAVIVGIGSKTQIPKGAAMNRSALGLSLVAGSLCWGIACAMQLVYDGKISFSFNFVSVALFFIGTAFFFRAPFGATRINQHGPLASAFIWAGIVLGLAHAFALVLYPPWQHTLLELFASLGLKREILLAP